MKLRNGNYLPFWIDFSEIIARYNPIVLQKATKQQELTAKITELEALFKTMQSNPSSAPSPDAQSPSARRLHTLSEKHTDTEIMPFFSALFSCFPPIS